MHLVKIEVNLCQNVLVFVDEVRQIHQDSQAGCDDSIQIKSFQLGEQRLLIHETH